MDRDFPISDEMISAFKKAWHSAPEGERVRAGLNAALNATWTDEDREASGEG